MYKTSLSKTATISLEEIITRLKKKDLVDAVLLMGSTGEGTMNPYSDIDMVVILSHPTINMFSAFTSIDNKIADI